MKKSMLKKAAAFAAAVVMCAGVSVSGVYAAGPADNGEPVEIVPMNVAINSTYNNLSLGFLGKLEIDGDTTVRPGYYAGVFVELQQYNGGWNTIKTWTDTGDAFANVETEYYVEPGYSYRLKLTHSAYTTSWTLVESFVKYSTVVTY